jgi:hypothetical protein
MEPDRRARQACHRPALIVGGARKLNTFGGEKSTLNDWRVITLEDWALIRSLAAQGVPNARIARRLGISRTTVIKAVNSDSPPRHERKPAPTSFAVFEPRVRLLLEQTPDMPATVLAERVISPSLSQRNGVGRVLRVAAQSYEGVIGDEKLREGM